ncbi:MAG: hypothetical protein Kow0059_05810 [Candidatus Sumerlaeia bacterium]
MANQEFFPQRPKVEPKIYAYEDTNPQYAGLLKIGYTTKSVQEGVAQQYPTLRSGEQPYRIVLEEPASAINDEPSMMCLNQILEGEI